MKLIKLTQNKFAQVDDENYDFLIKWKWIARKHGNIWYAQRDHLNEKNQKRTRYMHQDVMNTPKGFVTDHINRDGLDNRKENLRICTNSENQKNKEARGVSKYLGVSLSTTKIKRKRKNGKIWEKHYTYWRAVINIGGHNKTLGMFKTEEEAAKKYNEFAKIYHKEFANLNKF